MKRPILVITIGFILGIILGLYIKNIAFLFLVYLILIITKNIKIKKISRLINVFFPHALVIAVIISSLVGYMYIKTTEYIFEQLYSSNSSQYIGTVMNEGVEKEYYYRYKVRIENLKYKNFYVFLDINKNQKETLKFGEKIAFCGEKRIPNVSRNYKGFNYREYLKSIKVFAIINAEGNIKIIKENNVSVIRKVANEIKLKIINNIKKVLPKETQALCLGILIGYTDEIERNIRDDFSNSSLSHLLAISGMHISYMVIGISFIISKINIHKSINKIITSLILVFFLYIVGFTSSVIRACIMAILYLMQSVFRKKSDIWTNIAISIIIMLTENPYRIKGIGFILSYLATIGILLFSYKQINLKNKIKQLALISIYAQLMTFPIIMRCFYNVSLTFLISNIIAGNLIGAITICGFILIGLTFTNLKIAHAFSKIYNIILKLLLQTAKFVSKIPFSKIYIIPPYTITIIFYYIVIVFISYYLKIKRKKNLRYIEKRVIKIIIEIKKYIRNNLKILTVIITMISIAMTIIINTVPKSLKLYFIDVGQGDSSLIVTPHGKTVLIDGGGSELSNEFDIGEKVLLPYLLNRKIKKIDYMVISHFDSDHCEGLLYLMQHIKVKKVIIGKQYEVSANYQKFKKIVQDNNIKVNVIEAGNKIFFDKNVCFTILWPSSKDMIRDNAINNNSIVGKLEYKKFSMLFTGDIEEMAEKGILRKYINCNILRSTIIKVAHHGSKTSSTKEFIKAVNPQCAFIGVGQNNNFGHPADTTIRNFIDNRTRIYRTDEMGEIKVTVNAKSNYKIGIQINN